ncbi:DUF47 family protein [Candidatus Thorarchaeota archaeon]|nr:MAG: DUF47 family protein [Candidatus Thorarchaeota archaeon]
MVLDNGRFLTQELSNITQMLEDHFRIVVSANRIVTTSLEEWLDTGEQVDVGNLEKITSFEEKGDKIKNRIVNELAKANALMQREDLLRLVHYNDKLIDGAEIACYHLASVNTNWVPDGQLQKHVKILGGLLMDSINEQREAVRSLSVNMEKAMESANRICSLEKEMDILQRDIKSLLYPAEIPLDKLLRFRDFLNTMEEIANLTEDAAIAIRSLSLTLRV